MALNVAYVPFQNAARAAQKLKEGRSAFHDRQVAPVEHNSPHLPTREWGE
jgi:hypothetical protein